jgi:hypothetical protein
MQVVYAKFSSGEKVVDGSLLNKATHRVTFGFTPSKVSVECRNARFLRDIAATIDGQDIVIPLAGCRDGSKIRWYVYGN